MNVVGLVNIYLFSLTFVHFCKRLLTVTNIVNDGNHFICIIVLTTNNSIKFNFKNMSQVSFEF